MSSNNNALLHDILNEVKLLRNDIKHSRRTTSLHISPTRRTLAPLQTSSIGPIRTNSSRSRDNNGQNNSTKTGPARRLLNDIAARPSKIGHCWYHRTHGIAANPNNCPGPEHCSFDSPTEIAKMKAVIAKATRTSTPAQNRLRLRSSSSGKPKTVSRTRPTEPIVQTPIIAAPEPNPPAVVQDVPTGNTPDWSAQIEMELDSLPQNPNNTIETLEEQLADLSD